VEAVAMLSAKEIEKRVAELVKPVVEKHGLVLFDVKYKLQSGRWILTIVIDKLEDYVSTKDCENVSYEVERILDSEDLIPGRYYLEVSSPGLDRPLRSIDDFKRFVGSYAKVKTTKTVRGYIRNVDTENEKIVIEVDGKEITFDYKDIKSANLEIEE